MNDMENVTLQNGEIAFLQSGTVIMNVDTAIELSDKLEARQKNTNTEEQSAEEAMENVMLLLAFLFGPEILDGPKVSKLQKPVAPTMPARTLKTTLILSPARTCTFRFHLSVTLSVQGVRLPKVLTYMSTITATFSVL